jgi:hypothetical protein
MNRQLRRFAAGLLAIGAFSSAVSADQGEASSPFPVSTMYGSTDQRTFTSGYFSRFPAHGAYEKPPTSGPDGLLVLAKIFPPLILVMLPVMAGVLVVKGLNSAASDATNAEVALLPHQADGASQESTRE